MKFSLEVNVVFRFILQITWAVDTMTSYSTTLHILWFTILQFISLQISHKFKQFSLNYAKVRYLELFVF